MELEFVRPRKRLPTVGARVCLGVERPGVPPRHAIHVKRLVTPRTCVHPGDRVGVAFGVRPQDVDLVKALVAESTHVVLAARVHLAVACQRRVVDEPPVTHLNIRQTTSRSVQGHKTHVHLSLVSHGSVGFNVPLITVFPSNQLTGIENTHQTFC